LAFTPKRTDADPAAAPTTSDRPCSTATDAKLGGYGPLGATPTSPYAIRVAPVAKAEDHVKYLGSGCASISEAIRTGPNRGVRMDVIQGLREEYRQKCAIEDQDARSRARQDATAEQATKLAQRDVAQSQQQQAKAKADQCAGMRDVIATKRLRERDLNATEVAALRSLKVPTTNAAWRAERASGRVCLCALMCHHWGSSIAPKRPPMRT
jgi:hypothetical protein